MKYKVLYARSFENGTTLAWTGVCRVSQGAYVQVAELDVANKDEVFKAMQGEFMDATIEKELQSLIEKGITDHTSMSVGDLIVPDNGQAVMCDSVGWRSISIEDPFQ